MTTPINLALSTLIASHLASINSTLTDDQLTALAHLVGSTTLLIDALHLIDTQGGRPLQLYLACFLLTHSKADPSSIQPPVARLSLPNSSSLYQVSGSIKAYTVHTFPSASSTGRLGFCPCPAFAYSVLKTHQNCKHLLAVLICERLDAFVDKQVGLRWLAAWSSGFRPLQHAPPT
ncbi:BQ2448_1456 [Microbotryum intermedium]|uniref:BQ2448_1456 protein n=1 Tax=Microbotryum intermedium TaxID=269621 RepID=A0A238F867_9BASI|nr:BQ2448_1456 [Microbotryum intermedium]